MRYLSRALLAFFLLAGATVALRADDAAKQRELNALELKYRRENNAVDQKFQKDRIPLDAQLREALAAVDRDSQALGGKNLLVAGATGSLNPENAEKYAELQFRRTQAQQLHDLKQIPDLEAERDLSRAESARRQGRETAAIEAKYVEPGEDADKTAKRLLAEADLAAMFQHNLDALAYDEARARNEITFQGRTKEAEANRAVSAYQTRKLLESANNKNATFDAFADAESAKLTAVRDAAVNAMQVKLDELRADFQAKRAEVEVQREEERAKLP